MQYWLLRVNCGRIIQVTGAAGKSSRGTTSRTFSKYCRWLAFHRQRKLRRQQWHARRSAELSNQSSEQKHYNNPVIPTDVLVMSSHFWCLPVGLNAHILYFYLKNPFLGPVLVVTQVIENQFNSTLIHPPSLTLPYLHQLKKSGF